MAVKTYSITADEVKLYLPQYQMAGDNVPSVDEIDTDGHFLIRAASDVAAALSDGGYGLEPSVDTDGYAYQIIRNTIIERTALYFASTNMHLFNSDLINSFWTKNNQKLYDFSNGNNIGGEITPTEGYRSSKFYIGSNDTIDELNDQRFSYLGDDL